jgi:hypothetical protein
MTLKDTKKAAFDEFIMRFDDDITIDVAARLAEQLGVAYDPTDYDH